MRLLLSVVIAGALSTASSSSQEVVRAKIGETALAQAHRIDPRWHPEQRDCAGLIRFAYRTAFSSTEPARVKAGLWTDGTSTTGFANAETLLRHNFRLLGRGDSVVTTLQTGDVAAFRQTTAAPDAFAAPWHLMLVVRPEGADRHQLVVVYHTGDPKLGVRAGALRNYLQHAPAEWQPVVTNPAFLGFFRFKEWAHE